MPFSQRRESTDITLLVLEAGIGIIYWYYILVLYIGIIYWYYILVLCFDITGSFVQKTDQHHHSIERLVRNGTYTAHQIWVYDDDDSKHSQDSRYYGVIPLNKISQRMTLLIIFS